jgi:hypothetical protein
MTSNNIAIGDIVYLDLPDSLYAKYFGNKAYGFVIAVRQGGYILIRWFMHGENNVHWYHHQTAGLKKAT